jgi:nucleoside-triphosphatase THEP1
MAFKPAVKVKSKLRLCLVGPPGSGKTKSALKIAEAISDKVAVLDSEHGSAAKYGKSHKFDHDDITVHSPENYIAKIEEAEQAGYGCLIIDSLSHVWMGDGGVLEIVEQITAKSTSQNSYTSWAKANPRFRRLIERILGSSMHIIVTLRSKMAYSQEKDERGKTVIKKLGMEPIMRDGIEYEFDLVGDLDQDNRLSITKSRCEELNGAVIDKPGADLAKKLMAWLDDGEVAPPREAGINAEAQFVAAAAQSLAEQLLQSGTKNPPSEPQKPVKTQAITVPDLSEMEAEYKTWPKDLQDAFQDMAKRKKAENKMSKGEAYSWTYAELAAQGKITSKTKGSSIS